MSGFLDRAQPVPHCPGCGHPHVLRALDDALVAAEHPTARLVLVTDIGCVGLADHLFPTLHTVHTLHGRSVAVAAGLRMGDRSGAERPLKPVVLIGDGGVGIGLLHLVHAAQLNVDVTVLVHNNLLYGMTGGQHSVMTPPGLRTATTPDGCAVAPLDLGLLLEGAGAGFFARTLAPGDELAPILAEAILHPGFACVEILELCPTFATLRGGVTGRTLRELPGKRGQAVGVLRRDAGRPPLAGSAPLPSDREAPPEDGTGVIPCPEWGRLRGTARVVLAGRAGERVQTAALLAAAAAAAAGLHAAVRADNPVTQGSGFSLAELTLAAEPIAYTGSEAPDLVLALAPEGLQELRARGLLGAPLLADRTLDLPAGVTAERHDLRQRYGARGAALGGLAEQVAVRGWWRIEAWEAAVEAQPERRRAELREILTRAG